MTQKIVVFQNKYGLHTAAATLFVYQANQYQSSVWLVDGDRKVNAKSLLGVLSLGIYQGSEATLVANGSDEEKAVKELCELIRTGLDEADQYS